MGLLLAELTQPHLSTASSPLANGLTSSADNQAVGSPQPSSLFETAADRERARVDGEQGEQRRRRDYYHSVVGKSFWLKPGLETKEWLRHYRIYARVEVGEDRYRPSFGKVLYHDELVPKQTIVFEVVDCLDLGNNIHGLPEPTYQIRIENGGIAYMAATALGSYNGHTRRWPVDYQLANDPAMIPTTLRSTDKTQVYSEDPALLLATVEQQERALSEAKQREVLAAQAKERQTQQLALARAAENARKGGVRIGMTQQQVIKSSWGRPERVNRTASAAGTYEQWVYGSRSYLYFQNGILTTVQN